MNRSVDAAVYAMPLRVSPAYAATNGTVIMAF